MTDAKPKRILIVDDEEPIAWVLQESLQKSFDYEVITATSGKNALQLFADQPFDLLITDFNMPEMDGLTLAKQVHQLYPHTAIVLLSAYSGVALRQQTDRSFIYEVLDKPVKIRVIRRVVSEILNK